MILIEGNDKIPSYYISATEETNINYLTYMEWTKEVFVDYPEVYLSTRPGQHYDPKTHRFNDPYFSNYLRHPSYSYYPVQGVSWNQIQNYLSWKTDRLNEDILIRLGYIAQDAIEDQINEENFNTEAFVVGQFTPYSKSGKGISKEKISDKELSSLLYTGYRLPTEAEWDYAVQHYGTAKNAFRKSLNFQPFAGHFLDRWVEYYAQIDHRDEYYYAETPKYLDYARAWKKLGGKVDPNKRLHGLESYEWPVTKPIHMDSNVREWLLDYYTDTGLYKGQNYLDYLAENGFFEAPRNSYIDEYGLIDLKDSMGAMPFRILTYKKDGMPMFFLKHYTSDSYAYEWVNDTVYASQNMTQSEYTAWLNYFHYTWPEILIELRALCEQRIDNYVRNYTSPDPNGSAYPILQAHYRNKQSNSQYQAALKQQALRQASSQHGYFMKSQIYNSLDHKWYYFNNGVPYQINQKRMKIPNTLEYKNLPRLVKGGDWKESGSQLRTYLAPDKAAENVGFRSVIQYHPIPVKKEHRVRWK